MMNMSDFITGNSQQSIVYLGTYDLNVTFKKGKLDNCYSIYDYTWLLCRIKTCLPSLYLH